MTDFNDSRRRQAVIGRGLRRMYEDVVRQEVPDDFIEALCDAALKVELRRQEDVRRQEEADRRAAPASKADTEKRDKDFRGSRRRQDAIGRRLQEAYNNVLNEDVPEEFIKLLCEYGVKRDAPAEDDEAARRRQAFEKRVDDLFEDVIREKPESEQ